MPSTYKTPGVYMEEINKFPPSVAPVATAIPAFLGYTETTQFGGQDLLLQPTRISSLLEYETYFGGAPPREIAALHIDANYNIASVDMDSKFNLYDSLRLFYQNGGGSCYIIPVGTYQATSGTYNPVLLGAFQNGLAALKLKDEPTIIAFPDAVNMDTLSNLYQLQKEALQQCAHLQDRFAIFDLLEVDPADANFGFQEGVDKFRQQIGMADLKYGAAYGPHLATHMPFPVSYAMVKGKIERGNNTVLLSGLTNDPNVQAHLTKYDQLLADQITTIQANLNGMVNPRETLAQHFQGLVDIALLNNGTGSNGDSELNDVFVFLYGLLTLIDDWGSNLTFPSLQTDVKNLATNSILSALTQLVSNEKEADDEFNNAPNFKTQVTYIIDTWWGITIASISQSSAITGGSPQEKRASTLQLLHSIFIQVSSGINTILDYADSYVREYDNQLRETHTVFRNLVQALQGQLSTLPPSGAIAGVYARVDRDRGVWKSPANVSLLGVQGLTHTIDNDIQDDLNVDPVAGKSVNAIRSFTGKGILVWGARTLAGNDNEWRYVSVRRFFLMAEESIRKATEAFVFEPNDSNTWIRVRAMIENFLTLQWRAGALAGSKPEEAFFVRIGLGATMTPVDVLEGRMIVEIGMAVVRPAEFIVLRLSHKMQEA